MHVMFIMHKVRKEQWYEYDSYSKTTSNKTLGDIYTVFDQKQSGKIFLNKKL